MNKNSFFIITTIGLLLSNLLLVGFLLSPPKRAPKQPGKDPQTIVIEKLHFDPEQARQYKVLIQDHQAKIRAKDQAIRDLKQTLYAQLPLADSPATVDSLTTQISLLQKQIEDIHYAHFRDIKALCKADQQDAYARLVTEIGRIFGPKPPRGR